MQRTEPELERSATEQLAEENGPEPGSNPAFGLNASQPQDQNCADDYDKQNDQFHLAFDELLRQDLNQTDEEMILRDEVSDEALEAASVAPQGLPTLMHNTYCFACPS